MRKTGGKKHLLAGLLSLALCVSFAGCAARQDVPFAEGQDEGGMGQEAPAWERLRDEEPITLDWYVNFSWFATPWGGNVTSDAITEETGVSVNFITPMGNETEKLNALITADNLPDLITLGYWEPQLEEMVDSGMVYALNELADKYDAYFWEVTDPAVVNWYTQEDGNIYAYPNSVITPQDLEENKDIGSNQAFLVRKDIYEAIGSPDMSTQEGFCAAVREAARQFPEVDGKPLIPIGSHVFDDCGCVSFDKYLMNFLAVDYERDGKIYDRYTDEEYISWLKMFRQLGEEGYLANDIFVDTRTQMEEKLAEGRYFCMLYQYTDMLNQQKALYAQNPDSVYIAVEGPKNKAGNDPKLPTNSINGWTVTLISKKCKDSERAIAFLDYLLSEQGQKRIYLGVEGKTYEMVDGRPVLYEEVRKLLATDRIAYDKLYGADNAYWMLQDIVMQQQWEQEVSPAVQQLKEWSKKYPYYDGPYDIYFPNGSKEAQQHSDMLRLWSNTLPALLLAPSEEEFDAVLENYIQQRSTMGYDALMEAATQDMIESKEKLGIE